MGADADKAKLYRQRVEELCREAEAIGDMEGAQKLLALAREYDGAAKLLEARERASAGQKSG